MARHMPSIPLDVDVDAAAADAAATRTLCPVGVYRSVAAVAERRVRGGMKLGHRARGGVPAPALFCSVPFRTDSDLGSPQKAENAEKHIVKKFWELEVKGKA